MAAVVIIFSLFITYNYLFYVILPTPSLVLPTNLDMICVPILQDEHITITEQALICMFKKIIFFNANYITELHLTNTEKQVLFFLIHNEKVREFLISFIMNTYFKGVVSSESALHYNTLKFFLEHKGLLDYNAFFIKHPEFEDNLLFIIDQIFEKDLSCKSETVAHVDIFKTDEFIAKTHFYSNTNTATDIRTTETNLPMGNRDPGADDNPINPTTVGVLLFVGVGIVICFYLGIGPF